MNIVSAYVAEGELSWNIIGKLEDETTITIGTVNKKIFGAELLANEWCNQFCLVQKVMKGPTIRGQI